MRKMHPALSADEIRHANQYAGAWNAYCDGDGRDLRATRDEKSKANLNNTRECQMYFCCREIVKRFFILLMKKPEKAWKVPRVRVQLPEFLRCFKFRRRLTSLREQSHTTLRFNGTSAWKHCYVYSYLIFDVRLCSLDLWTGEALMWFRMKLKQTSIVERRKNFCFHNKN